MYILFIEKSFMIEIHNITVDNILLTKQQEEQCVILNQHTTKIYNHDDKTK